MSHHLEGGLSFQLNQENCESCFTQTFCLLAFDKIHKTSYPNSPSLALVNRFCCSYYSFDIYATYFKAIKGNLRGICFNHQTGIRWPLSPNLLLGQVQKCPEVQELRFTQSILPTDSSYSSFSFRLLHC